MTSTSAFVSSSQRAVDAYGHLLLCDVSTFFLHNNNNNTTTTTTKKTTTLYIDFVQCIAFHKLWFQCSGLVYSLLHYYCCYVLSQFISNNNNNSTNNNNNNNQQQQHSEQHCIYSTSMHSTNCVVHLCFNVFYEQYCDAVWWCHAAADSLWGTCLHTRCEPALNVVASHHHGLHFLFIPLSWLREITQLGLQTELFALSTNVCTGK